MAYSSEQTRWYCPEKKEPVEMVPSAKGDKMVKTTIRQARKMGLLPSVTSILKVLSSYSLQNWIIENTIKTCIEYPFERSGSDEEVDSYINMIQAKANEYSNKTSEIGKDIHASVEKFFEDRMEPDDPVNAKIVSAIREWAEGFGGEIVIENGFASVEAGYAGTPDILIHAQDMDVIGDLKTTSLEKFKAPYDKWMLQLGAYRGLTERSENLKLVQIVADRDSGEVLIIEHEDPLKWHQAFMSLFQIWCTLNNYDPRKGPQ